MCIRDSFSVALCTTVLIITRHYYVMELINEFLFLYDDDTPLYKPNTLIYYHYCCCSRAFERSIPFSPLPHNTGAVYKSEFIVYINI